LSRSVNASQLALWGFLCHELADPLLLGVREVVTCYCQYLQIGLPGEQNEQRSHAPVPIVCKPILLLSDRDVLQPIDMIVSEHLHKLIAIFCTAVRFLDMQRVQAATVSGGDSGKFKNLSAVGICRTAQDSDLEDLKVRALDDELAQWPLM